MATFKYQVRNINKALSILTVNEITQELANKEAKRKAKKFGLTILTEEEKKELATV